MNTNHDPKTGRFVAKTAPKPERVVTIVNLNSGWGLVAQSGESVVGAAIARFKLDGPGASLRRAVQCLVSAVKSVDKVRLSAGEPVWRALEAHPEVLAKAERLQAYSMDSNEYKACVTPLAKAWHLSVLASEREVLPNPPVGADPLDPEFSELNRWIKYDDTIAARAGKALETKAARK